MARTTRVRRSRPAIESSTAKARSGWPENISTAAWAATSSSTRGPEVRTAKASALMASAISGWHKPQLGILGPGDRQAQGHLLPAGEHLAEPEDPLGCVEGAQLVQRLTQE